MLFEVVVLLGIAILCGVLFHFERQMWRMVWDMSHVMTVLEAHESRFRVLEDEARNRQDLFTPHFCPDHVRDCRATTSYDIEPCREDELCAPEGARYCRFGPIEQSKGIG